MPVLTTLNARNTSAQFIEQKYIDRVLREEVGNLLRAQDKVIAKKNVARFIPEIGRRTFTITTGKATVTHPLRQRFIDMKYRRGVKQTAINIHNKPVYSHFNKIVRRMAFGFTEDMKNLIANEYNVQL